VVLWLADFGQRLCLCKRSMFLYLLETLHKIVVPAIVSRWVRLRGLLHGQTSYQLELIVNCVGRVIGRGPRLLSHLYELGQEEMAFSTMTRQRVVCVTL